MKIKRVPRKGMINEKRSHLMKEENEMKEDNMMKRLSPGDKKIKFS